MLELEVKTVQTTRSHTLWVGSWTKMEEFMCVPLHSWYLLPIPAPIHNNIANQFVAQYSAGPVTGAACADMEIFLTNLI